MRPDTAVEFRQRKIASGVAEKTSKVVPGRDSLAVEVSKGRTDKAGGLFRRVAGGVGDGSPEC